MTAYELESALVKMFKKLARGSEPEDIGGGLVDDLGGTLRDVTSYERDLTDERGLVLTLRDGAQFHVTIRRSH
jgi:hypothetical protein